MKEFDPYKESPQLSNPHDAHNLTEYGNYLLTLMPSIREVGIVCPSIVFSALGHCADRIAWEDEQEGGCDTAGAKGPTWEQVEKTVRFWARTAVVMDNKGCSIVDVECLIKYGGCKRKGQTFSRIIRLVELLFVELETARREYGNEQA